MGRREITQIEYDKPLDKAITLCLGFFDSLHVGHIQLIHKAQLLAHKYECQCGVFTFVNNPFEILGNDSKQVLNYEERVFRLRQLGVDFVVNAMFDKAFADIEPAKFLENLTADKTIKAIVVGSDYTYGKMASGNINTLKEFCDHNGIELVVEKMKLLADGSKISSRYLRKLVQTGNLSQIASQLNTPYFVMGKVSPGRRDGSKMGRATANIEYDEKKEKLPCGVYNTNVIIDGVKLKAVTNVGNHPTFGDNTYNIETHIIGLNQELYGKTIVIEFLEKIRDIKKFNSMEELSQQIAKDVEYALSK